MRFQRDADEMTGSTAWVRQIPTWSPMAEYYVVTLDEAGLPVTPVTSKVDYESVDYAEVGIGSVRNSSVMEEIYFCTAPGKRPGECEPRTDQAVTFNHFYYPGWRAYLLDGKSGPIVEELPIVPEGCTPQGIDTPSSQPPPCPPFPAYSDAALAVARATQHSTLGRMVVPLPPVGEGFILLRFEETLPRRLGLWISLASVGLLLLAFSFAHVKRRFTP